MIETVKDTSITKGVSGYDIIIATDNNVSVYSLGFHPQLQLENNTLRAYGTAAFLPEYKITQEQWLKLQNQILYPQQNKFEVV